MLKIFESEVGRPKSEDKKIYIKLMIEFKFEKLVIWQKAMEYGEILFLKKNSENITNLHSI